MANWKIGIVSDVHVTKSGVVPADFTTLIEELLRRGVELLVVNGDSTSGNEDDGVSLDRVRGWWQTFRAALAHVRERGVPILPIAGNHDYYTAAHQRAYTEAWQNLAEESGLTLCGNPPLFYSTTWRGVHLQLLHVVDQELERSVETFATDDLRTAAASSAPLRLSFGHVPLVSRMGHSSEDFKRRLGRVLTAGGVASYFSGHEHLVWDEKVLVDGAALRQVHVGTASGTYHFPLRRELVEAHCQGNRCVMPYGRQQFLLLSGTRQQRHKVSCAWIEGDETGAYEVLPLALEGGQLVQFWDQEQ